MKENELRNCPFCNAKPYYGGYPDIQIRCDQCRQSLVKASWYQGDLGTMEACWNRRVELNRDKLIEALETVSISLSSSRRGDNDLHNAGEVADYIIEAMQKNKGE